MRNRRKAGDTDTVDRVHITRGSGNVFADLGLPNPDEWNLKAKLAREIGTLVEGKTQVQVAGLLGIDQPKVSALLRGKLKDFSIERLMNFLRALGQDVDIRLRPRAVAEPQHSIAELYIASEGSLQRNPVPSNPYGVGRLHWLNPEPRRWMMPGAAQSYVIKAIQINGGTSGSTLELGQVQYFSGERAVA